MTLLQLVDKFVTLINRKLAVKVGYVNNRVTYYYNPFEDKAGQDLNRLARQHPEVYKQVTSTERVQLPAYKP